MKEDHHLMGSLSHRQNPSNPSSRDFVIMMVQWGSHIASSRRTMRYDNIGQAIMQCFSYLHIKHFDWSYLNDLTQTSASTGQKREDYFCEKCSYKGRVGREEWVKGGVIF